MRLRVRSRKSWGILVNRGAASSGKCQRILIAILLWYLVMLHIVSKTLARTCLEYTSSDLRVHYLPKRTSNENYSTKKM